MRQRRLRAAGSRPFDAGTRGLIADPAGLGSRQDQFNPEITLTTRIPDVALQIAEAGFERFELVGHSSGGIVITGVTRPTSATGSMPLCPNMAGRDRI